MAKVLKVAALPLTVSEVAKHLQNPPPELVNAIPPVKPKAGEVYLFRGIEDERDNWRCDQYRWINQGVRQLPKKEPVVKKSYFQTHTRQGASTDFTRHAYQLLNEPSDSVILVQYMGDEKAAEDSSHGNSRANERSFVRTCPSVLRKLDKKCLGNTTAKVYKSEITKVPSEEYLPVLQPRNAKQVENIRYKQLQKQRLSHDALYNIHELANDLPGFVHAIHTHPDLLCVLGQQEILDQLDRVLLLDSTSQLLSYDTTFQLGDFYLSVLCFKHTVFKEAPVIPAAFFLHERKFEAHHKVFFTVCSKLVRSLSRTAYPIVTDEEKAIVNSISEILPNASQLRCWNHIFRDVTRWLRSHGAPAQDISVYVNDVRTLFHLPTENEYSSTLESMKEKWSAPFFDYYNNNVNPDIHGIARWAIEPHGIYDPFSGITNNQSESLNFVIKQLQEWHESPLDCMALSLYHLQSYYMMEICRGQRGLGSYHTSPQYHSLVASPITSGQIVYSPNEIVTKVRSNPDVTPEAVEIKENLPIDIPSSPVSQRARAHKVVQEGKISYDSKFHVFTVLGSEDKPQAIKLFPKATCTCPSTKECYHVLAAKMYLGIEDTTCTKQKLINLTQLRKNARKRKDKKSGRKIPRVSDCEVHPAPDAATAQDSTMVPDPSIINDDPWAPPGIGGSSYPGIGNSSHLESGSYPSSSHDSDDKSSLHTMTVASLSKILENQLADSNLLRLWRTGGDSSLFTSEEDECPDLSSYIINDGDYALSKDTDVALWLDYRHYMGYSPLEAATPDFIVVNNELHKEYDDFRATEVKPCFP